MRYFFISIIFGILSINLWASQKPICPDLSGKYFCVFSNQSYSVLKVDQKIISELPEISSYRFDYLAIPGETEFTNASPAGEDGGDGWITYCVGDRLSSIYYNGSMKSEWYLAKDNSLVRAENDVVVMSCPKMNSI